MEEAILNFGKQFDYVPEIKNNNSLSKFKHVVVLGMGGSHLAVDIARNINPFFDVIIHSDYGLPEYSEKFKKNCLFLAISYSGNTEEVIDGLTLAEAKKYPCGVISKGGKLIEFAKSKILPHIELPNENIQPRMALGYILKAVARFVLDEKLSVAVDGLKGNVKPEIKKDEGIKVAESIRGYVPIVYASRVNGAIANNWKIKFNETGKIPAFYNVIPELNHNEMTGFDFTPKNKELLKEFIVIFLKDMADSPQVQKRMLVCKQLIEEKGVKTIDINISEPNNALKVINAIILADWVSLYIALSNGADPDNVPMVESFKKLIA